MQPVSCPCNSLNPLRRLCFPPECHRYPLKGGGTSAIDRDGKYDQIDRRRGDDDDGRGGRWCVPVLKASPLRYFAGDQSLRLAECLHLCNATEIRSSPGNDGNNCSRRNCRELARSDRNRSVRNLYLVAAIIQSRTRPYFTRFLCLGGRPLSGRVPDYQVGYT